MNIDTSLAAFLESAGSGGHLRVEADRGGGFYRLRIDEAERRQAVQDIRSSEDAVIELLRNSRDAHARNVFVSTVKEGTRRTIVVVDDGDGIPPEMHELVFEPRVTSKLDTMNFDTWGVHGRGMALFSIAQNAVSARVAASDRGLGASIVVETDTSSLSERTDQSTFPSFILEDEGSVLIRGPKNIARTVCEFALEHRSSLSVFLGSPSEIAAAIFAYGESTLSARMRAFSGDASDVPLCKRLAFSADPEDFAVCAADMGLVLSDRTARRILDGEIRPARTILERIERVGILSREKDLPRSRSRSRDVASRPDRHAASATPKFDREDLDGFARDVSGAFSALAEAYFLDPGVEVSVSAARGEIKVTIPIVPIA